MAEFDLINQFFKTAVVQRDDVKLGIGDDCALLSPPPGKQLAVSTDTLVSGVHFPANTLAVDIGYKSLAVNLSDLAAMGAEPAWVSLALTLPEADHTWLKGFMQGFNELAKKYNVVLIGGDTTQGPLSITVNITGFIQADQVLKRSQAKVGDLIFVTGTLGDAATGLHSVLNNIDADEYLQYCIKRLNRPDPRIQAGIVLAQNQYSTTAIDLSDGLIADLGHICQASNTGARIELENIPLSRELKHHYNNKPDWNSIINAGDDYELCFTCAEKTAVMMQKTMESQGVSVSCIGEITDSSRVECFLNNEVIVGLTNTGYEHF